MDPYSFLTTLATSSPMFDAHPEHGTKLNQTNEIKRTQSLVLSEIVRRTQYLDIYLASCGEGCGSARNCNM